MTVDVPTKCIVDGQPINIADVSEAVEACMARSRRSEGFTFLTLNLDHLVKRRKDSEFRRVYLQATFVSADGQPVVALARRDGINLDRTTGADLIEPLCGAAAEEGLSIFLFGSRLKTLEAAAARLKRHYPKLLIAGMEAPPMGFDMGSPSAAEAAERIARSGARLCFIALPARLQLQFISRFASPPATIGFVGVGAALDFLGGAERRAPKLLQRLGFEWIWRLLQQPDELLSRYLQCALLYASLRLSTRKVGGVVRPSQ
jgi:N-acetylglucosaminyldiphosphoundecaprenol N-acetyl-beta-D-mannosaminyltransferase